MTKIVQQDTDKYIPKELEETALYLLCLCAKYDSTASRGLAPLVKSVPSILPGSVNSNAMFKQ